MLAKNQIVDICCTGLGADFEGICRHEGQVVFVPGALPGENIRARIIKVSKAYAIGKMEERRDASQERVTPPCPYYGRCGGCTAQHIDYDATLRYKRQQVIDCLTRIGGMDDPNVAPLLAMGNPWRYRNKAAFPVGYGKVPQIGCYAPRSHTIIDAPAGCLLQSETSNALTAAVRHYMLANGVPGYDETAHRGLIRHVITREAKDGSAMLLLSIRGEQIPHAGELISLSRKSAPSLASIVLSENKRRTNVILGDRFHTLYGEDALMDSIAGFSMRVSPRTFFQVNREQAERLYQVVLSYAALTGSERVLDVYCGCGSITLPLASQAAEATGIEIVPDAIRDAQDNARRNGVENVSFLCGAAEHVLPEWIATHGAPDVVVVDPPRKGCELEALHAIAKAAPQRIVYVSCNPATLARDVRLLAEQGYSVAKVQPVDMFCWTGHVECVVLLMPTEKDIDS